MSSLQVFNKGYRLEIQSIMLVFSTPLVNYTFYTMRNRGGEELVIWRAYTGVIHCVFDQILNLQNCFNTSNKT